LPVVMQLHTQQH